MRKLIEEKVIELLEYLDLMNDCYNDYVIEKSNKKVHLKNALSKYVEEIIEISVKLNGYLLKMKNDFSGSYYDSFIKLSRHYDFDEDLLNELAKLSAFRNKLVHNYTSITQQNLIKLVPKISEFFKSYANKVYSFLKNL